jgi:hypothetical protein
MNRLQPLALTLVCLAAVVPAAAQDSKPDNTKLDRTELERTPIVGNRELPKVLYIVPWKKPPPMPLSAKPPGGVLDEPPTALDRDVLRRQVKLQAQLQDRNAPPTPNPAGEKR